MFNISISTNLTLAESLQETVTHVQHERLKILDFSLTSYL